MHTLPEDLRRKPIPLEYLLVDVGLSDPARAVRPGDLISFAQPPIELAEDVLSGHSLDNRASLVAMTECLRELGRREHDWDVLAVATVQEEETFAGAYAAGFELKPSVAIAVDVTFARGPGLPEHKTFPLGKGPANGWGPNMHPGIYSALEQAAKRVEIPLTREVLPAKSGTDAFALQIAGGGIPTGLISIPLKYMHTPVEVVSVKDVRRTGRLLAEFVAGLDADFMDTLSWD
jgi:endoglucanase